MSHCVDNLVPQYTVGLSVLWVSLTKPKAVDMTETVQSLSNFFSEKNMTVQIFTEKKKRTMCGSSTFPPCVIEHVSDFPLSNSNHKPVQRGESAPVCVKNRTWYYRGISKRPVKIKGFREVLCSNFGHCQHFFGIFLSLMWLVKTVFYLRSNTSRPSSRNNDWKGARKSEAQSKEPNKNIFCTIRSSQHHKPNT